jgi:hypothetical protein
MEKKKDKEIIAEIRGTVFMIILLCLFVLATIWIFLDAEWHYIVYDGIYNMDVFLKGSFAVFIDLVMMALIGNFFIHLFRLIKNYPPETIQIQEGTPYRGQEKAIYPPEKSWRRRIYRAIYSWVNKNK